MTDPRQQLLTNWTSKQLKQKELELSMVSGDASFRRYFRTPNIKGQHYVAVDAPPEQEDVATFVALAKGFLAAGIRVPKIYARDVDHGFMLLEDFGDSLLLGELNASSVDELYAAAMQALVKLNQCTSFDDYQLPKYDGPYLQQEMQLFSDWFLDRHLELNAKDYQSIVKELYEELTESALAQKQVCVHRDFHSRNLLLIDPEATWSRTAQESDLGIIDFQDAMLGPVSYDLASLIKDCYISWPREKIEQWIKAYHKLLPKSQKPSLKAFTKDVDLMGMQRHLKAIGIFCRLNYRDAKPGYVQDIPRTLDYLIDCCERYPAPVFKTFAEFLTTKVMPKWLEKAELNR
jgi:N-acetylmuramate 1-kinase